MKKQKKFLYSLFHGLGMPVNFEKTGEHAQEKLQMFASSTSKVAISANTTGGTPKQSRALRLEAKKGDQDLRQNSP